MNKMDTLHHQHPQAGSRMLSGLLKLQGFQAGRKRVRTLMKKMNIRALAPKPRTTTPNKNHHKHPYLLRNLTIEKPNQVWCMDITYLPMARGFAYLVAVMDWASRKILSWRLSNTMDVSFCLDALQDAIEKYGVPGILNTDQGSQFTSNQFHCFVAKHNIAFSMDSKGAWLDNRMIERFWRTLKYEEVYLKAYDNLHFARIHLYNFFDFYNNSRPHSSLPGAITPSLFYSTKNTLNHTA